MKTLLTILIMLQVFAGTGGQTKPSKYGPVTEGYFRGADGVRLFYRKVGKEKKTVVFLHGGPGLGIGDGGYDMEPLAGNRVLLMYDQRGSGRSEIITDPQLLTADYQVRDLEAFRQHFKLERMTLIGLSWGTGLATLYAAAHPDRVERLLLVSPMPPAKTPYWEQRMAKINNLVGRAGVSRLSDIRQLLPKSSDAEAVALCREAFTISSQPYFVEPSSSSGAGIRTGRGNDRVNQPQMNADTTDLNKSSGTTNREPGAVATGFFTLKLSPGKRQDTLRAQPNRARQRTELIRERVEVMCDAPPAALRNRFVVVFAVFDSLGDWDFGPMLTQIKVPALVVEGEKTNVPLDATRAWATALPNGRLLLIPNAGHVHFIEQPIAFFKAAEEFLRGK